MVQTKFGEIKRLLSVNGQPLSGEARRNEERRIRKLIANDEEFQKKQKEKKHDGDQSRKMLEMLPQAFNFHYDGIQSGLIRLVFTPNLNFHPTDREAEVFHHMEGVLFVTPEQKRLAGIDGLLTTPVKFAGGLLGHLDKGGTFSVRQKDMGSGHWEITLLDVHMNGKALFFKTISVREKETYSDYEAVPGSITVEQAAALLKVSTAS